MIGFTRALHPTPSPWWFDRANDQTNERTDGRVPRTPQRVAARAIDARGAAERGTTRVRREQRVRAVGERERDARRRGASARRAVRARRARAIGRGQGRVGRRVGTRGGGRRASRFGARRTGATARDGEGRTRGGTAATATAATATTATARRIEGRSERDEDEGARRAATTTIERRWTGREEDR